MSKKIHDFEGFSAMYKLAESVEAEAQEISQEINPEEIEDVDPEKIAATLSKLIDVDGDLDKIDIDQIAENFQQILEEESTNEEENINESATGLVYVLEVVGTVLGNADLVHAIGNLISKKLGKKVDLTKAAKVMKNIVDFIKKASGYPAKILKKFFEWIAKILGFNDTGQRLMGLISLGISTVIMLLVGILYFPAAAAITGVSGVLALILSITALIGKATEITTVIQEIVEIIKDELKIQANGKEATPEEMEQALSTLTLKA